MTLTRFQTSSGRKNCLKIATAVATLDAKLIAQFIVIFLFSWVTDNGDFADMNASETVLV